MQITDAEQHEPECPTFPQPTANEVPDEEQEDTEVNDNQTCDTTAPVEDAEDPSIMCEKKSKLKDFLKLIGAKKLFTIKRLSELSYKHKQRKMSAMAHVLDEIVRIVVPKDYEAFTSEFLDYITGNSGSNNKQFVELMEYIVDAYFSAETTEQRRAILMMPAKALSYQEVLRYFPNLTPHFYYAAKNAALNIDKTLKKKEQRRPRYSKKAVSNFIGFLTE